MTTTEELRRQNDLNVLRMLTDMKAVTKNEVAAHNGVTLVTAGKIIRRFHERGLLTEAGIQDSGRGRKASLYSLNSNAFYIAAVAVSPNGATVALYDANMRQAARAYCPINRVAPFHVSWERIAQALQGLLQGQGVANDRLLGIGYTLPGIVDAGSGIITFLPQLKRWNGVNLKALSEERFGVHTMIEKDNYASVVYLKKQGAEQLLNAMVMTIRGGIGCGIIMGNRLVRGENGLAGEIGHICVEKDGNLCVCGNRGCLETYASDDAIVASLREEIKQQHCEPIPGLESDGIRVAIRAAADGHGEAVRTFARVAEYLAEVLVIALRCYDPEIIFIDSDYVRELPFVQELLQQRLIQADTMRDINRVRLSVCEPSDYSLLGAGLMVFNEAFHHYKYNSIIE